MNEAETMIHRKRKITIWIITIAIIAVALFGAGKYISYRTMPPFAAERNALKTSYGDYLEFDDFNLWYEFLNPDSDKTPIIVIAGGSGLSSDYLEDSLQFLSDEHPLLFYDARGCGRSQIKKDLSHYSISKFADECKAIKDFFFPDRNVIVLAHSFGGLIAMEYAAKYEASLEGLVLISSVYADYKPQNTFAFLKTGLPPKNQDAANEWYMENIDAFLGGYFYNTQAKTIFSNTVTSYAVSAHVGGAKKDISEKVQGLEIPTLILVGEKNEHPLTTIDTAQKLNQLFLNSELHQIKHCGHFMFAEVPVVFQDIVLSWIQQY